MAFVFRRPSSAAYLSAQRRINTPPPTLPPSGVFTLSADSASYVISGQTASLAAARIFSADFAAYAISPQSATLQRPLAITADVAAYVITANDAAMTVSWNIHLRAIQETTLQCVARAR